MIRILQTKFGSPGGNCHQAALASLLEMPLSAVPDFCNLYEDDWDIQENKWLIAHGLFSLHARLDDDSSLEWFTDHVPAIVSVKSLTTAGALHSVIYHKGHVVHDPHPSQVHRWRDVEITGFDIIAVLHPPAYLRSRRCETCRQGPNCEWGLVRDERLHVCDDGDWTDVPTKLKDLWEPLPVDRNGYDASVW